MTKIEFLLQLEKQLAGLPEADLLRTMDYYNEIIDDRAEDMGSETEAVAAMGTPEDIAAQVLSEFSLPKLVKEKIKPRRRMAAWEIVLLCVGAPIWLSLLIAAFAVILSVYIVLWSAILSIWAVFVSLGASALGCVGMGVVLICVGNALTGIAMIGVGLVCAGLAIFLFFGCMAATKGTLLLTKTIVLWLKKYLTKKEEVS